VFDLLGMYYGGAARLDERKMRKLDFGFCAGILLVARKMAPRTARKDFSGRTDLF
jgi:hypothetical protein